MCVENRLFVDDGDAYLVHDFLEFNPSKAEQEDKKRKAAERARRHRKRKAGPSRVTQRVTARVTNSVMVRVA
ncbi:MAG: hypothetical protein SangKO_011110 [Sandaracinaceae bacterium]